MMAHDGDACHGQMGTYHLFLLVHTRHVINASSLPGLQLTVVQPMTYQLESNKCNCKLA